MTSHPLWRPRTPSVGCEVNAWGARCAVSRLRTSAHRRPPRMGWTPAGRDRGRRPGRHHRRDQPDSAPRSRAAALQGFLRDNPDQVTNFVDETLRYDGPAKNLCRQTTTELTIAGVT